MAKTVGLRVVVSRKVNTGNYNSSEMVIESVVELEDGDSEKEVFNTVSTRLNKRLDTWEEGLVRHKA